ncbi:MAG: M23 family metallopeptidase [Wolbachia endosymbiont of Menacanthus eurysternus]|nr:MAG: M23 family metallopeptidase [Wolbachia endosymbiont of Menacanthus eurysternus]
MGCNLQKPAPVLFKGEEFYGKRDLESIREYHLFRENIDLSTKEKNRGSTNNFLNPNRNNSKMQNIEINEISYKFVMPIKGTIILTAPSDEICSDGVRIIAQKETSVISSAHGKVIYVGEGIRWYGNLIIVEHKESYITMYSYLRKIYVKIGDEVKQGQVIGSAGKLGIQDKNLQMCFTIRHSGQIVDPLKYISYD